jgi:hypothetical protein
MHRRQNRINRAGLPTLPANGDMDFYLKIPFAFRRFNGLMFNVLTIRLAQYPVFWSVGPR